MRKQFFCGVVGITVELLTMQGGCSQAGPPSQGTMPPVQLNPTSAPTPSVAQLRERWLQDWVHRNKPASADAINHYLHDGDRKPRGSTFASAAFAVERFGPRISGLLCLELLGIPDFWHMSSGGEAELVYFYDTPTAGRWSVVFTFGPDGQLLGAGWNAAGVTDWHKLGFFAGN